LLIHRPIRVEALFRKIEKDTKIDVEDTKKIKGPLGEARIAANEKIKQKLMDALDPIVCEENYTYKTVKPEEMRAVIDKTLALPDPDKWLYYDREKRYDLAGLKNAHKQRLMQKKTSSAMTLRQDNRVF
jgi:uncharacterized protein YaiE (UPF0345 family)